MKKIKLGDTVYYSDPVNDEFSGITRPEIKIGKDFPFIRNGFLFRFFKFFVYSVFVRPFAFLYCKIKFKMKLVGAEKLRKEKNGYFLFGNHTQVPGDGFIPNVVTYPKETHVVVNSDNLALKGTRALMQMLGALPVPTELSGFSGFQSALAEHIKKRRAVVIYPEAHIWPYASVIRPFSAASFSYPVKLGAPSYCFTVTYQKSKRGKPVITVYVDGPFFGNGEKPKEKQQNLRDRIFEAMAERAAGKGNYAFVKYLPREGTK